jgi:hypothetical protein
MAYEGKEKCKFKLWHKTVLKGSFKGWLLKETITLLQLYILA